MASSFPEALAVVEAHKAQLPVADPDAYIAGLKTFLDTRDDARASVLIAVDAAKSLITIAIAFFAALGGFALNFLSAHGAMTLTWSILLFAASGVLTIASMVSGFNAIGRAYKNGQKPGGAGFLPWTTKAFSGWLGAQSMLGLAALLCFALAVMLWKPQPSGGDAAEKKIDALSLRVERESGEVTLLRQRLTADEAGMAALPDIERRLVEIRAAVDALRPTTTAPAQRKR